MKTNNTKEKDHDGQTDQWTLDETVKNQETTKMFKSDLRSQ